MSMKRPTIPSIIAEYFAMLVCCSILASPVLAWAQCKLGLVKVTTRKVGGCKLHGYTARVEDAKCPVEVNGAELECGRLRLGDWERSAKEAVRICKVNQGRADAGDLYWTQLLRLVSRHRGMVSVDEETRSFSGGAHKAFNTPRRTYGTRSGKEVTLEQLFPRKGKGEALLARAKGRFQALNSGSGFTWDPRAFSISVKRRKTKIEFACPHRKKAHQGETLKINLTVKGRPRRPPR